uniref:Uncharacterized protein n=1 Tax=viral metagenome TaxID=1070528 RepID=A0A6M3J2C6_9ZZZZ
MQIKSGLPSIMHRPINAGVSAIKNPNLSFRSTLAKAKFARLGLPKPKGLSISSIPALPGIKKIGSIPKIKLNSPLKATLGKI